MRATEATLPTITECLTIGGVDVDGEGSPIEVFNPANEETIAVIPGASAAQLDAAVEAAAEALPVWSGLAPEERAEHILRLADVIESHADELEQIMVSDVGTPIALTRELHVAAPIAGLRTYADLARVNRDENLSPRFRPTPNGSVIAYRPAGVVAAIVPYNYPLNLSLTKVGAALAAGCTAVLMPSQQTPLGPLLLGRYAREAGLPDGALNVLVGDVEVMIRLTEHPDVRRVTFTGSVPHGRQVMTQAAGHLAPSVLELGGKSANIVMPGTNLAPRMAAIHQRYARNAGQGCQSPTRILVHEDQYDEFVERSIETYASITPGDPWDPKVVVGPLISAEHRARVEGYVEEALADGGKILAGGGRPGHLERGWYMNPVLVGDVENDSRICQEELFGPVSTVLTYADLDEAVEISNATEFGLAAHVTTDHPEEAMALGSRLEVGSLYINGGGGSRHDAPLGGVKASGVGRERGEWGVREFLEPQHMQWAV